MYSILSATLLVVAAPEQVPTDLFQHGEAITLKGIPANERAITCLALDDKGRVYGATAGTGGSFFVYDPATGAVKATPCFTGGAGFAYGLARLADGSFIAGVQADPTGLAREVKSDAVGKLVRLVPKDGGKVEIEGIGIPVKGQGVYTLAYLEQTGEVVGLSWPEGHFFTCKLKTKECKDHGPIAGHRTFETPQYADLLNKSGGRKVTYPRAVSRAIAVVDGRVAYTAGAGGQLYRYDGDKKELKKLDVRLPSAPGRENWATLDAVARVSREGKELGAYHSLVGATSDGYLFELRLGKDETQLRSRGKTFAQPGCQALVLIDEKKPGPDGGRFQTVYGFSGPPGGLPRGFVFRQGGGTSSVWPGPIPHVDGALATEGFGAMVHDGKENLYAGELDRLGRLIRFRLDSKSGKKPRPAPPQPPKVEPGKLDAPPLDGHVVFAPTGTTSDGSGYTALEVGKDGQVYVGAARYGDYGWLLRFDPAKKPLWMDKVVGLRELSGERKEGVHTQGKIHAKILVGADGKVWFASKQAHESFENRPEYEDYDGYPGGHLCSFDPKTGFSRSHGILMPREGLMAGTLDDKRGRLYYRSEPRNHFLVFDLKTGDVSDRGNLGAQGRYMALDDGGRVWATGRGDTLSCYDPARDVVEEVRVELRDAPAGGYQSPYVLLAGPKGKVYGIGTQSPGIFEYDVDRADLKEKRVPVRVVGQAAPPGLPVLDIHSAVFGKDGKLYYPLTTSEADPKKRGERFLLVMRFDPATGKTDVVGKPRIVGLDEEKVKHAYVRRDKYAFDHTQGAAVGPDGSLYVLDIYPQLNVVCFPKLTAPK